MRYKLKNHDANLSIWVMLFFVLTGLYFRLKGLGRWPFADDEFYLAQSVQHILDSGLPEFKCGGYYVRGLLYQYLVAPFIAIGYDPELCFRLVPFFSHVIALPGLYKLSTKVSGKFVAVIMVSVFSLSTIEIEMSRFARMYMPFQALFIWYLYFLYRVIIEKDHRAYSWIFALSIVSPLIFEGGFFLAILNFLPCLKTDKINLKYLGISIFIFLFAYFYLSFDFRHFPYGFSNNWPSDIPMPAIGGGGAIYKPYLLMAEFLKNPVWLLPFLLPLVFSIRGVFQIIRNSELAMITRLSIILCLLFSVCNFIMLSGVAILVLLLLDLLELRRLKSDLLRSLILPISINFIFWVIYGLVNGDEYGPLAVLLSGGQVEKLIEKVFNKAPGEIQIVSNLLNLFMVLFYPIIGFLRSLYKWLTVYSFLILASGAIIVFNLYFLIIKAEERYKRNRFLFALFILNVLMVSFLNIGTGTRYTFFLYPVFLLMTFVSIKQLSDKFLHSGLIAKIATACIFILIFVLSKDFNLNHILNIDSAKINFRKGYSRVLAGHFYPRLDYRGVAQLIEANSGDGDLVISAHQTVRYYTGKVNYIIWGYKIKDFSHYTACKGKKELWTNANLLYKTDQLFDLIEHSKNIIWVVINIANPRQDEAEIIQRYKDKLFFKATDGKLGIFRIDKTPQNAEIEY